MRQWCILSTRAFRKSPGYMIPASYLLLILQTLFIQINQRFWTHEIIISWFRAAHTCEVVVLKDPLLSFATAYSWTLRQMISVPLSALRPACFNISTCVATFHNVLSDLWWGSDKSLLSSRVCGQSVFDCLLWVHQRMPNCHAAWWAGFKWLKHYLKENFKF